MHVVRRRRSRQVDSTAAMSDSDRSDARALTLAARACALESELATLRAALEGCFDAFYLLRCERDQNGEIVDFLFVEVNRCGERLLRRTREQLIGAGMCELFPLIRSAGLFAQYRRVVDTREPLEQEYQLPARPESPQCQMVREVAGISSASCRPATGSPCRSGGSARQAGAARARRAARATATRAKDGVAGTAGRRHRP